MIYLQPTLTSPQLNVLTALAVAIALAGFTNHAHAQNQGSPDAVQTGQAVTSGATKGSFKLPGSNTSVTLGGYVKFDAIYSDRSAGAGSTGDQEYEAGAVPVGPTAGDNERDQVKFHARQSRFFAKTSTPSPYGDVTTYIEFDLFGANGNESISNSHGLRVRHAYGSMGGLLAGQTWTNLFDVAAYPDMVDFGGPAGVIFARQPQLRWTQAFSGGQWSVALENPETVASLPSGTSFRADDDRLPDLTAMLKFDTAWGKFALAGLARQIRVDSAADPASRGEKTGSAFGFSAVIPALGADDLRVFAYAGNGIGRYTAGFFTDALLDSRSNIVLPDQFLATAAYRHFWSPSLRSTLAVSSVRSDNPLGTAGSVNKTATSAHLNLIWSPIPQTNFGLELIRATRETQNGQTGELNRVQLAAQYSF